MANRGNMGSGLAGLGGSTHPVKATLSVGGDNLTCYFNPTEYTVKGSNKWDVKSNKDLNVPTYTYSGPGDTSLSLELLFDTSDGGSVSSATAVLWKAIRKPDPASPPPHVIFSWGSFTFEAVVTDLSQKYILFREDGTPIRSIVTIGLNKVKDESTFAGTNPTSGGFPNNKIHTIQQGDRLDLLAAKYYKKPTMWRYIAEHNDIDNPSDLTPGTRLFIPPLPTIS
jgi:hypothetical protein